ncbi:MAG: hypothetical protein J7L15_06110 [Clostridiales bacterium]|nr:hypothetical protein [Clostridiales bacterium]
MRKAKDENVRTGIVFILVGFFLIAYKFGLVDFRLFWAIGRLWPLILIVIGINIIFQKTPWVKAITWTIFIIIVGLAYVYYFKSDMRIFGRFTHMIN